MKFKTRIEILRPINAIFGGISVVIGLMISHEEKSFWTFLITPKNLIMTILGFIIFFTVAGGTNTINDYFDIEADLVNRPNRPLPRGEISKKMALRYYALLNGIALVLAGVIGAITVNGIWIPLIVLFFEGVGFVYSWKAKASGLPGNIMVGIASAVGFPFASLFLQPFSNVPGIIWYTMLGAAVLLTSREFVKGMQDVAGDQKFGVKTIANTMGYTSATIFTIVFSLLGIFSFNLMYFLYDLSIWFLIFIIIQDGIVITANGLLIKDKINPSNQKNASFLLKMAQLAALLALIFGS
ncbi:Digeranylgeranylglyceryl phosphate synthase [Candidatus Lokiarchaeum ossiferum]|uniref:Digeranylgeranylglyceryl phosphate synthase n=1 Tax=Candidatus Lokiarchaeum ossiferum TaxID=2951803 RepID=A0ABY6HVD1_9ARCH|nr:Digeranylgeranylglyceryl phosphate synthase [Candidatus Lokiarchaeum sp. B-35]